MDEAALDVIAQAVARGRALNWRAPATARLVQKALWDAGYVVTQEQAVVIPFAGKVPRMLKGKPDDAA